MRKSISHKDLDATYLPANPPSEGQREKTFGTIFAVRKKSKKFSRKYLTSDDLLYILRA